MTTATGIYFDGQVARGRAVSIEFTDAAARISGEGITEEIALAHLRVSDRLGDVPRFLHLPNDAVIETADNAIVDAALANRRQARASRLIHALESRQSIAVAGCVMLVAVIAALAFYAPPALARVVAKRVPADNDQRIGTAALATLQPYFRASSLSATERSRVEQQLVRLQASPSAPRPRLEFRSMNGLPNAFALPGNIIIVTDELVRLPASDDEIAALLAHELGHLEKRHGLQSLLRNSFALLIVASVTGDLSALTSFAGTLPLTLLTAGYSRDLEREADRFALDLLRARRLKPRAFVTVLVKLDAACAPLQRSSAYLSTHPATGERTALFGGITDTERKKVLAEPWDERANDAMNRRNYQAAILDYNRLIELAPTARAYAARAKCHFLQRDSAPAEADIAKALELEPMLIDALVLRAEMLALSAQKFDDAIAVAKKALALDAKNSVAMATLGYAELMKGNAAGAKSALDRAIEWSRSDYRGRAYRGLLETRQGDAAGALADYDEALKLEPTADWVRVNRGVARNLQRDFTGALADFTAISDPAAQTADYFLQRGIARHSLGQADEAVAEYARVLDKDPRGLPASRAHFNRGSLHAATGNYRAAALDYDAGLQIDPTNGIAYLQRAFARRQMDNPSGALADLAKAMQFGADVPSIVRERAAANWDLANYADAVRDYDRILEAGPEAPAYEARGLIEFSLGDWEHAEADLSAYLSTAKKRPGEYVEFFLLLTRRCRKVDDQQKIFQKIIAGWPDGWAKSVGRYLSGQITESQLLAETRTGTTPTHDERLCEACFYIGMTHLLAENSAAAEEFFQKCIRTGVTRYYEYKLARAELGQLQEKS